MVGRDKVEPSEILPTVAPAPGAMQSVAEEQAKAQHESSTIDVERASQASRASETQQKKPPDDFPDGGLAAYGVLLGCGIFYFGSFGLYVGQAAVLQQYFTEALGKSNSSVAWITSFQVFLLYATGPLTGKLFDAGYYKQVIYGAALLQCVCKMLLSLCTTYYQVFLALGVGEGLAMGLLFNTVTPLPNQWFFRRRSYATAIVVSSSSLGGCIWPIAIEHMLPRLGFPWTMRVVGFMLVALYILAVPFVRTRLPPRGVEPAERNNLIHAIVDVQAIKQPAFLCLIAGIVFILFGFYVPYSFMTVFANSKGLPLGSNYIAILNAASTLGRIGPGIIADNYGRFNMLVLCSLATALMILLLPAVSTSGGLIGYCIVWGCFGGSWISAWISCVAQLGDTSTVGKRIGGAMFCSSIPALVGVPIAGAILGSGADLRWWSTGAYGGAFGFVGVAFMIASRVLVGRSAGTWKA